MQYPLEHSSNLLPTGGARDAGTAVSRRHSNTSTSRMGMVQQGGSVQISMVYDRLRCGVGVDLNLYGWAPPVQRKYLQRCQEILYPWVALYPFLIFRETILEFVQLGFWGEIV